MYNNTPFPQEKFSHISPPVGPDLKVLTVPMFASSILSFSITNNFQPHQYLSCVLLAYS